MFRKNAAKIHLYVASFLAPIILMISISGGLYLFGFKGTTENTIIESDSNYAFNISASNREQAVRDLLNHHGLDSSFEYVKQGGNSIFTRPTSEDSFVITMKNDSYSLTKVEPDLIKKLVELHKGHGPLAFKTLQKLTAIGLVLILLTGIILALSNKRNRKTSLITMGAGFALFLVLAF